jgi:SPP1 gp7 family putative phage head morphogenesis protein
MREPDDLLPGLAMGLQAMLVGKLLSNPSLVSNGQNWLAWAILNGLSVADLRGREEIAEEALVEWDREPPVFRTPSPRVMPRPTPPPLPPVPEPFPLPTRPPIFQEALEDVITRTPELAADMEEVGRRYTQSHAFAVTRSSDIKTTQKAQQIIASAIREGKTVPDATKELQALTIDWSRGYAETVYRTNLNTATNNGRIAQAKKPWVRLVAPGMVFDTAGDDRVRPNHKACDGMVAPHDHPYIQTYRPPLGFNCRCQWRLATKRWAQERGLIDENGQLRVLHPKAGAGPDPGFIHVAA